jgi:hypothetical protein
MKYEIPFRIIVTDPPPGVDMKVQKGRAELLEPAAATKSLRMFEFSLRVDLDSGNPNFLGPFAQGPKDARFVYVNSGTYAGQAETCWSRRAKLSLMSISREQVETVLASAGSRLETAIHGTGRDGGPVCASVKGLEWRVAGK